jgi:TonB family protein
MFETLSSSRRSRPAVAFSVGAHAILIALLTVPPLLATQEPPEPEDKMPVFVPVRLLVEMSEEKPILLRKGREPVREGRRASSEAAAPAKPESFEKKESELPLPVQPSAILSAVPPAPDSPPSSLFEEGERSEREGSGTRPGTGVSPRGDGGNPNGCDGCPISADAPDVIAPVPIVTPEPHYPETALRARMSGRVTVEAIIGTDGSVRDVRVLRSSSPLFETSAIEAVHRWRYVAARIGSRVVPVYLTVNVTFTLRS